MKGIATTSRITNSAPAPTNSELFAATPSNTRLLKPYCDGLIMGKLKLHTAANDQFSGMYETHLSVDVKLISTTIGVRREFLLRGRSRIRLGGFAIQWRASSCREAGRLN